MAGGIDWFRWHHGSVTDPKFALVARRAGASLPDVLAVWAYALEAASSADERGMVGNIDTEAVDCLFGFPSTETRTASILDAMRERKLIDEHGHVVHWNKRQPKRERDLPDASADRVRAHRATKSHVTPPAASDSQGEPCNASNDQKKPRGEESREEKKEEEAPQAPPARARARTRAGADKPPRSSSKWDPGEVELPPWLDRADWQRWCLDRRKRGKQITEEAARLQLLRLHALRREGHAPKAVIDHSIAGSFQGLYPPKLAGPAPPPEKEWHETPEGVCKRGAQLGMKWDGEPWERDQGYPEWRAYKAKVLATDATNRRH